ncbi:MAG: SEC-C metal-binding domain-containing protein, partial [Chitinophagales bacterium]
KVEENNFGIRKRLLEYDDVMNSQRELIYKKRNHALDGERLGVDLNNTFMELCEEIVNMHADSREYEEFTLDVIRHFSMEPEISKTEFEVEKTDVLAQKLYQHVKEYYKRKQQQLINKAFPLIKDLYEKQGETLQNVIVPFTDGRKGVNVIVNLKKAYETNGMEIMNAIERSISLIIIDEDWKDHLRNMDDLKQSVQNAVFEQKDPLLIYKFEAFSMFKIMLSEVNKQIASFIFKGNIPIRSSEEVKSVQAQRRTDMSQMKTSRDDIAGNKGPGSPNTNTQERRPLEPVRVEKKVGRNDPCPCGSGKKYKNCHGANV